MRRVRKTLVVVAGFSDTDTEQLFCIAASSFALRQPAALENQLENEEHTQKESGSMQPFRRATVSVSLITALMTFLASTADARVFRMSGKWVQQRGAIAFIPIIGGIPNAKGGPGGGTFVSATGSAPATLTVPGGAFTGMNMLRIPLPGTTLVQLSTQFNFFGPGSAMTFAAGPKTSRPANFGFCPGAAANPNCVTPASGGSQGMFHGLVKYTAGPNQFGGTMQMLISGGGAVSVVVGASPTRIQHNPIGGGAGSAPQEVGGTYGNTATNLLVAGPITTGGMCAQGPCAGNNGLIINPGVVTGAGASSTNAITGFPWTTGMVSAIVTTKLPTTNSTLTGTGSDMRTDLGAGNITLVAGGIARRRPSNTSFPSVDTVTMTIRPQNLPSMTPTGLVILAMLIALSAGLASVTLRSRRS